MNDIIFRKANTYDYNNVANLYSNAIKSMEANGIYQWDELYPNKDILKQDVEKSELYIGEILNEIVTVFVLN